MTSTAYHRAGDPIDGRRATRYGAVVAGIALAAAVAVTLTGRWSAGDDATPPAAGIDHAPDVISQQAATDTMITRTLGDRNTVGYSQAGEPAATDTMITRTLGDRNAVSQPQAGEPPATDTMITRTLGDRNTVGHSQGGEPAATDTMITRSQGG